PPGPAKTAVMYVVRPESVSEPDHRPSSFKAGPAGAAGEAAAPGSVEVPATATGAGPFTVAGMRSPAVRRASRIRASAAIWRGTPTVTDFRARGWRSANTRPSGARSAVKCG